MHWTEAEELAAVMLGLDPDNTDSEKIENGMADKFGIDMETFQKVAEALMPLTVPARAALSGDAFQGFVHGGAFICKRAVQA
jgi:hypothetical protein